MSPLALLCDKVAPPVISEYYRKQRQRKPWVFNVTPGNGCYFLWCSEASTSAVLAWQFPAVHGLFIKRDAREHFSVQMEKLDKMLQRCREWQMGDSDRKEQTRRSFDTQITHTKALCHIWLCLPNIMFPLTFLKFDLTHDLNCISSLLRKKRLCFFGFFLSV